MSSIDLSLVSACTALVASVVGPLVTLSVARRQFAANVISANRQRWSDSVRDLLAELISQVVTVMVIRKGRKDNWDENLDAAAGDPGLLHRIERIVHLLWKIKLLLAGDNPDHAKLSGDLEALVDRLKRPEIDQSQIRAEVEAVTRLSQSILMREWERVKRGA